MTTAVSIATMKKTETILDHFKLSNTTLTDSQQNAYKLMISGANLFLTGPAGTGKSYIIEKYYNDAVKKYGITKVFKTSTTGISAINIGGRTIHSFSGIGIGADPISIIIRNMRPTTKKRIQEVKVLFIDEISMLDPNTLDKIYEVFSYVRNQGSQGTQGITFRKTDQTEQGQIEKINELGIQFILSGDCYQLSPVKSTKQCFEAVHWKDMVSDYVELKEIIRQNDIVFQTLLNEVRIGILTEQTIEILKSRINKKLENEYGILPTILYPTNNLVDYTNNKKLQELISTGKETHVYKSSYKVISNNSSSTIMKLIEDFKKQSNVPDELTLSVGAQVIFKKNIKTTTEQQIANGTRGVVSGFTSGIKKIPIITLKDGTRYEAVEETFTYAIRPEFEVSKTQVPLKLAYATSIHASQGSSIDLLEIDIGSKLFEYGQAYVALSRVRTLEGLTIKEFDASKIIANPKITEFYEKHF